MDSDTELLRDVRGQVGVNQDGDLPEQTLATELKSGKNELSREIRERLNNGDSLSFGNSEAKDQALEYFLLLRARTIVVNNQNGADNSLPDLSDAPSTIATMRRYDFGDSTMNHWRDRMVTHLNQVTE
jgi:hypothetical protein